MCLEYSFFKDRADTANKLAQQGYISLEQLEAEFHVSVDDLIERGFLTRRAMRTTVELNDYEVSQKGAAVLAQIGDLDLVMVRPNCADRLLG